MLRHQNEAIGKFTILSDERCDISSLNKGYVVLMTSLPMSVDQPISPRVFVISKATCYVW
jgi:hypothetical protein